MKSLIVAGLMALSTAGMASAAEIPTGAKLILGGYEAGRDGATVTQASWIGRYGQLCEHGPVWVPACHASNTPGPYIPGHWDPMGTRWIPGHYS